MCRTRGRRHPTRLGSEVGNVQATTSGSNRASDAGTGQLMRPEENKSAMKSVFKEAVSVSSLIGPERVNKRKNPPLFELKSLALVLISSLMSFLTS